MMKLVFIYGPPAVGKLTVARQLAKLTGFRLFHNHVSIDFAKSVFDFGTRRFWRLVDKVRTEVFDEAAEEGVDLIFTFVYSKGSDDSYVRRVIRRVSSRGGRVCFVRLYCDKKELARRVRNEDRRGMGKLDTKSELAGLLARHELFSEIPHQSSLSIDTSSTTPRNAANLVAKHYGLSPYRAVDKRSSRR